MANLGSNPLICMPIDASNPTKNYGSGGDFTLNGGGLVGARGASEFIARSISWNGSGSNAYLSKYITATGTNTATIVMAVKSSANYLKMFGMNNESGIIRIDTTNASTTDSTFFQLTNSSNAVIVKGTMPSAKAITGEWTMFFFSVDTTNTGKRHLYIDDDVKSITWNTYINDTITHTGTMLVGTSQTNSALFDSPLSSFYYSTEYIDFSQESNRNLFRNQLGYPRDLQPLIDNATIPTPLIYLPFDDTANLGKNNGTGGDFTVVGTVTAGADFTI